MSYKDEDIERNFNIDKNENMNGWYEYVVYCYGQDNRACTKPTRWLLVAMIARLF